MQYVLFAQGFMVVSLCAACCLSFQLYASYHYNAVPPIWITLVTNRYPNPRLPCFFPSKFLMTGYGMPKVWRKLSRVALKLRNS